MPRSVRVYHELVHRHVDLHWHEFYEMGFIVGGEGTHTLNGVAYPLSRGTLFLLTPADFHGLSPCPGAMLEIFNVIFSDDVLAGELHGVLFRELKAYSAVFTGPEFVAMEAEFRRLWSEANESRLGRQLVIQGSLERILIDLARKCLVAESAVEHGYMQCQHRGIQKALIYIHHHFRESLTLRDVAAQAHLSPNYFSECFHRITGCSFQAYVQSLRLQFAM